MAQILRMEFKAGSVERTVARLRAVAPQRIARALSRGAGSARTFMAREVSRDMGLKVSVVRDEIRLEEPNPEALTARLIVKGKRIPLIDFNARGPEPSRGRGRGVTARIGGSSKRYPHAFIATMRSGHRGVFTRVTGARRRGPAPARSQLPIVELRGPSLPHVFSKYLSLGVARGQEQIIKNLEHELKFALQESSTSQ